MKTWMWIALGGATGSMGRHGVNQLLGRLLGQGFPWGTLAVNALGCFLLPLVLLGPWELSRNMRLALGAGFLGAFTTFSTFGYDTLSLVDRGPAGHAALNVVANVAVGLTAAAIGWHLARSLA